MIKQDWKKLIEKSFFKKCCKLICNIKPINNPKYWFDKKYNKPEDFITNDYVEAIKNIDIAEDIRTECGSNQKSGNSYSFTNPDITFSNLSNSMKTFFECKILGENSKYIGKDGMQRFITEKYGFNKMPFYGMLGYVKDDNSAIERYTKLERSINDKRNELNLTNQNLIKNSNSETIFETKHATCKNLCNKKIFITHILHSWN